MVAIRCVASVGDQAATRVIVTDDETVIGR
jgi:hypothetical protein